MQPSSRDLFVLISYIDSEGVAQLYGLAQIHRRGSTCMVAIPILFKVYVGWSYVEIDKTNKLGIQAKVQFQDMGAAQLITWPRPFEKNPEQGSRFSCILHTVSYIRNLLNAFALTAVIFEKV